MHRRKTNEELEDRIDELEAENETLQDQVDSIAGAPTGSGLPRQCHRLLTLALHTGLRKTEQHSLKWADVDFKGTIIAVRQSKSEEPRLIPINSIKEETLRKILQKIDNPFVFAGSKPGERQNDLLKGWERFLAEAGIVDFHWHGLRHTFASRLVMKGLTFTR